MKALLVLLAFALCVRAESYVLVVAGLGGEPDYEQRFTALAKDLGKETKAELLFGPAATREALRSALSQIAQKAGQQDDFTLVLIGHGTFDGVEYKFNLPGPDIGAVELAALLDRIKAGKQLVVNTTSASGASLEVLRRENRIVIAATRSGTERNATIFARYWVEALHDTVADADKNETISAREAFDYAQQKTKKFFETQKRLATEHAQLLDGAQALAGHFVVARFGAAQAALRDPAKRALLATREDLEQKIDKLKFEKAAMPVDEYKKQLTALLLDLARTQAELDK
jgi:hypothetical protein